MENGSEYSPLPARRSDVQRTSSFKNMSAEIEQVVTRLLRTTKSLLEALNLWSQLRMSTTDIFDLHRTLESQFYLVSQSFESAYINTSDLTWIPHQLRQSVMECMEQEPSTAALDQYLPRIRDAIVHLLHGLKGKQQELRDMDMQVPQMSSSPPQPQQGPPVSQRNSYRSQDYRNRSNENYVRNNTTTTTSTASNTSLNYSDSTGSARSTRSCYSQQDHTSPAMMSTVPSDRLTRSDYDPHTGGMPQPIPSSDPRTSYGRISSSSSSKQQSSWKLSHTPSSSSAPAQQPIPSRSASRTLSTQGSGVTGSQLPHPPASALTSPRDHQSTKNNNNDFDESDTHTANALAALKRQENLARRSSVRRTSMYRGNNTNPDYASKRYLADAPPVPSLFNPSSTTSTLNKVDENRPTIAHELGPMTASPSSSERTDNYSTNNTTLNVPETSTATPSALASSSVSSSSPPSSSLTLYLQMDQQMKKVSYSGEISLPALSMLFIEQFGYSAGQQDFPNIYIRDSTLPNVSYELQDLTEVVDKTILSLTLHGHKEENPVDWVNSIVKEWNETRHTILEQMERLEQKVAHRDLDTETLIQQVVHQTLATTTPIALQQSTTVATLDEKTMGGTPEPTIPEELPNDNMATASSVANDINSDVPVATTTTTTNNNQDTPATAPLTEIIKVQQNTEEQQQQRDEIEKLQRQVMILRQAQMELQEEHAKTVTHLEEQNLKLKTMSDKETNNAQQAATIKATPSQARHYIEQGKEELLTSSDKITTRLEDLQDAIDHLKLDVTQRKCRPSETQMEHCREERKALADDIEAFGTYIAKVKPTWKKTWEQELQTIVKEQQTLKEQEGLLLDMNDDLCALQEVFENLEKICAFQEKSHHQVREFHVAPPEDGFEGMTSVLKQVATIDVDHGRRLKALEMADRMRQRELANRTDEFEKELSTFVGHKKLKKTGGAMEMDRLRQEKDMDMIQRLYKEKQQQQQQPLDGNMSTGDELEDNKGSGGDDSVDPATDSNRTQDPVKDESDANDTPSSANEIDRQDSKSD
ncbi:actin interacting protein 3-domain-containing protein [Absidia repens]|uniref:Actin interacting protein 3-domain-containing protein n=1 Tax=Absidia repens TaxID=90262 RepID=A0A1X2ISB3_9FUNG|nr:actin interacting protein 3-domain-containing protein [Absidia repens]